MTKYFTKVKFPNSRLITIDLGYFTRQQQIIPSFIEVDVTDSRKAIGLKRAEGLDITFNSFILKTLADLIMEYPEVQAIRYGRNKLIIPQDVDIATLIEREIDNTKVPLAYIIRKANEKSFSEISSEIENAKSIPISIFSSEIGGKNDKFNRIFYILPSFIRRFLIGIMLKIPKLRIATIGTIVLTNLSMLGKVNGWFVQTSAHPLSVGVGSVTNKPSIHNNEIMIREILHLTLLFNHDIIDGAQMAKFTTKLVKKLESTDF